MRQFTVVSGSNVIPTASVTLVVRGDEVTGAATGTGPVDAAMEARESLVAVPPNRLESTRGRNQRRNRRVVDNGKIK
jgi:D-citramalate synthase